VPVTTPSGAGLAGIETSVMGNRNPKKRFENGLPQIPGTMVCALLNLPRPLPYHRSAGHSRLHAERKSGQIGGLSASRSMED
jgi:hypothetical protein